MVDLTIADKHVDLRKFKRNLKDAYKERQGFIDLIKEFLESKDAILSDGTKLIDVFGNPELEEKFENVESGLDQLAADFNSFKTENQKAMSDIKNMLSSAKDEKFKIMVTSTATVIVGLLAMLGYVITHLPK